MGRYVLVGCGGITGGWFQALAAMPEMQCAGLVDLNRAAAEKRASEFKLAQAEIGTDLAAMLAKVKPDIVFDCTVPESHVNVCTEALNSGCHVLGEKPLADSMDHARKIVESAKKNRRIHAVIQNRRFEPNIRAVKEFLASGAIGRVHTVYSDFFIGAHFGGFRDKMKHVLLLDMAIHTLDAARFLTGTDPVSVIAQEWNPQGSWYDHDASACAMFEMSGGLVYGYRGSWCAEGLNTTWESHWRFIGDRGGMLWNGGTEFKVQKVTGTDGFVRKVEDVTVPPPKDMQWKGHAGVIHNFLTCVKDGGTPETVGTDNIKSLAMVHAAIESAGSGKRVRIGV